MRRGWGLAALVALLPGLALAQQGPQRQGEGEHPGGQMQGRPMPGGQMQGHQMPGGQMQGHQMPGGQMQGHQMSGGQMQGRPMMGGARPMPTYVRPLPPRGEQFWHRGGYFPRVHAPPFAYPHGWGYRQWLIGQRVPPWFLAPGYVYPGWAALGVQAPPPGYAWERWGPDLLLVNLDTGEVEDVIYGAFY